MTREEMTTIFADRLNILKNERDVSYREIERCTGIGHSILGLRTQGIGLPNSYSAYKLAEFFGVSIDWLLGLSDKRERTKI